jgi:hypothetical protein
MLSSGLSSLIKDHLAGGAPGWLRCSFFKYSPYSRSSRLASRAPRSAIWSLFSEDRPLGLDLARGDREIGPSYRVSWASLYRGIGSIPSRVLHSAFRR